MKLEIVHDFPCTPDAFFDVIESAALEEAIAKQSTSKRELEEERHEGSILVRKWRITPTRELPGVIQKLLGVRGLSYVQTSYVDRKNRRIVWSIESEKAAGRADIGGVLTVVETPTGCRRTMAGTIEIRVPLLGRKVEQAIAKDVQRTYERSHRLVTSLLSSGG